jgi:tellurite resistance protein TehA-like permease
LPAVGAPILAAFANGVYGPAAIFGSSMQADPAPVPSALAGLSPASFALVMATGIVSLAARLQGLDVLAWALFALNAAAWLALCGLSMVRAARYPRLVLADLADHLRGPGFFTSIAATAVLGSQFILFGASRAIAVALGALAVMLWLLLTYTIFTALTVKRNKPALGKGINGAWLLAVVAPQSLAVLAALLASGMPQAWKLQLNFFALSMWLWGGMLYVWMISLIFYRYTFLAFTAADLTPPYWINMGAMAISTLAGSLLIANAPDAPFLQGLLPFLKGFTVLYWATGTWWIPMLLLLTAWRYLHQRFPMRYDPLYWGAVFPLGMYSASTHEMTRALGLDFLGGLAPVFFYAALAAWALAFIGLLRRLVSAALPTISHSTKELQ